MKKNIAVAAACITFAVLIGNSVNVSAESIPVKRNRYGFYQELLKMLQRLSLCKKKGLMWKSDCFPDSRR